MKPKYTALQVSAARHTAMLAGISWIVLAGSLTGCSGDSPAGAQKRLPVHKVTGTIMFNGQPVDGATVSFHPEEENQPGAFGKTDEEGKFVLRTYADGPAGAPEGKYTVIVQKSAGGEADEGKSGAELFLEMEKQAQSGKRQQDQPPVSFIPEKYSRAKTSDLKATVTAGGPNDETYELKN
jgi:hypothetical protein